MAEGMALFGEPTAVDLATGKTARAPMAEGELAGECVPVTKLRASSERDVWPVTKPGSRPTMRQQSYGHVAAHRPSDVV